MCELRHDDPALPVGLDSRSALRPGRVDTLGQGDSGGGNRICRAKRASLQMTLRAMPVEVRSQESTPVGRGLVAELAVFEPGLAHGLQMLLVRKGEALVLHHRRLDQRKLRMPGHRKMARNAIAIVHAADGERASPVVGVAARAQDGGRLLDAGGILRAEPHVPGILVLAGAKGVMAPLATRIGDLRRVTVGAGPFHGRVNGGQRAR